MAEYTMEHCEPIPLHASDHDATVCDPVMRMFVCASPAPEFGTVLVLFFLRRVMLYSLAVQQYINGMHTGAPVAIVPGSDSTVLYIIDATGCISALPFLPPAPSADDDPALEGGYKTRIQANYRLNGVDTYYNMLPAYTLFLTPSASHFILHPSNKHVDFIHFTDRSDTPA
jgi:hypothetical protein